MRSPKNSLLLAIAGWLFVALIFLAYFLGVLWLDFSQMLVSCQGFDCNFLALSTAEITALSAWGLSTHSYAYFISAVTVLVIFPYWVLGGLIVWRQGDTQVGLLVSLALIIIPISTYAGSTDWATSYPKLVIPGVFLNLLGTVFMLIFFYLIPNGRFSPSWAYAPLTITILLVSILTLQINGMFSLSDTSLSILGTTTVGFIILGGGFHIYRYRLESTPLERQQTKWILFGVITYIMGVVLWALIFGRALNIPAGKVRLVTMMIGWPAINITQLGLPLAITIAILRHRLWDIDFVIRRTLQYALLTGLLASIYFVWIALLQGILSLLARQVSRTPNITELDGLGRLGATVVEQVDSPLITMLTTLGFATLFNPLRIRIQDFIDRRFFRKKYDAEKALAQFAVTSRDEMDMGKLTDALLDVVEETMQPEQVSLWINEPRFKKVG